jgi:hypothetical protein
MEKISSILPATARVTAVDLKNSGVARPGTPSFGREVGMSSVLKKQEADIAARANKIRDEQAGLRTGFQRDPRAEIVQRMADDFFINKARQYEQEKNTVPLAEVDRLADLSQIDVNEISPVSKPSITNGASDSDDGYVSGQHLDVMA